MNSFLPLLLGVLLLVFGCKGKSGSGSYTVTVSGDNHETIAPSASQAVASGATVTFKVTPSAGYALATTVMGTCSAGSWASGSYTTGAIEGNCSVLFTGNLAPAVNLTSQTNFIGIYNDGATFASNGGFDHGGFAFSSTCLPSTFTSSGVSFALGAPGVNDMFNSSAGVTLTLPAGNFAKIWLVAAGVNGAQTSQSFVMTYSDSSSTTFTQSVSDWAFPQNYPGESTAVSCSYRNSHTGVQESANAPYLAYLYSFPLDEAKTVSTFQTPANVNVQVMALTLTP